MLKMHTNFLKFDILCQKVDITERAQKCDFSVNFHILIEQTGFRFDILCQKVDKLLITPRIVFLHLT